jgi:hypothetical protein
VHFELGTWDRAVICGILRILEITILSALILATRCANHREVFVAGNIYFTDADCYARMTRVQKCWEHPGLIVRRHDFENFPRGITPHTTAPFDYLILGLSRLLEPFTAHELDLAGALVSPVLACLGGWFLWWWSKRMRFRYRWIALIMYVISPILVHATEIGRPDHQSLLILIIMIAICAEWSCAKAADTAAATDISRWSAVSGVAWGLAIWTSAYESLVLFLLVMVVAAVENPNAISARFRRTGWIYFLLVIVIELLIERRVPSFFALYSSQLFKNWAQTLGELQHVWPANPIWLRWCGYLLFVTPFLVWVSVARARGTGERAAPVFIFVLLVVTYVLTIWQARWAYFFVLLFALALLGLLEPIKSRAAVWIVFLLSILPILHDWDEKLWPHEAQLAERAAQRNESAQLRNLSLSLRSPEIRPFLAPWWLSPSIAYWSGQPGIAGSSHESLDGIADTARFFLSDDWQEGRQILQNHHTAWVVGYDFERVAQNSKAVLNRAAPAHPLCRILDSTPSQAPPFLVLSAQNGVAKLYRVVAP